MGRSITSGGDALALRFDMDLALSALARCDLLTKIVVGAQEPVLIPAASPSQRRTSSPSPRHRAIAAISFAASSSPQYSLSSQVVDPWQLRIGPGDGLLSVPIIKEPVAHERTSNESRT